MSEPDLPSKFRITIHEDGQDLVATCGLRFVRRHGVGWALQQYWSPAYTVGKGKWRDVGLFDDDTHHPTPTQRENRD